MIKETHRWPIKSFAFKSSARPGWRNIDRAIFPQILLVFEKFARAYLFQIALEIM